MSCTGCFLWSDPTRPDKRDDDAKSIDFSNYGINVPSVAQFIYECKLL